ncbi:MAG: 30S ribosomal protein S21, partial [Gemmataceae bacterium]
MPTMPQVSYSPTTAVYDQPSTLTPVSYQPAAVPTAAAPVVSGGGLAQQKAEIQARAGNCFHPGGSLGGGTHEGCGYSSVSADHAIRCCCYWGQRTPIDIGVARDTEDDILGGRRADRVAGDEQVVADLTELDVAQADGILTEARRHEYYEKPSEKRAREKAEAIRRARKLARKKAQREAG